MEILYDGISIQVGDLVRHLEFYAKAVMCRMRRAEPELADCWTACLITFDNLQPEFQFGSKEDLAGESGILVLCPFVRDRNDELTPIKNALEECHQAFRNRKHGGVAEQKLRHDIEQILGMPYED